MKNIYVITKIQVSRIILMVIILLIVNCIGEKDYTRSNYSVNYYNLKGNVRSLSDKVFNMRYVYGSWNKSFYGLFNPTYFYENRYFNKEGMIIKEEFFTKDSTLLSSKVYRYSSVNQILRINTYLGDRLNDSIYDISISGNKICYKGYSNGIKKGLIDNKTIEVKYKNDLVFQKYIDYKSKENHSLSNIRYTRNDNNDIVQEIEKKDIFQPDSVRETYKTITHYLEYDNYNNWIRKISYTIKEGEEATVGLLTVRRIKYRE